MEEEIWKDIPILGRSYGYISSCIKHNRKVKSALNNIKYDIIF